MAVDEVRKRTLKLFFVLCPTVGGKIAYQRAVFFLKILKRIKQISPICAETA